MDGTAPAYLAVAVGSADERIVPIRGRVVVGRGSVGEDEPGRVVIDDPAVSRNHLEIRLDVAQDRAWVTDMSTNGTRLNGARIERAQAVPLAAGDRLTVGPTELEFRSEHFVGSDSADQGRTVRVSSRAHLVMAVGDIAGYSTFTQVTDSDVVSETLETVYGALRGVLTRHRGALADYAGDAMFCIWDQEDTADAAARAVDFTLEACEAMAGLAPSLPISAPDGGPLRLGWAVVEGNASVGSLTGALIAVVGDATNLAFRLSGLAGREGRTAVIVTDRVRQLVGDRYVYGDEESVEVKGRTGAEHIVGVVGRA